jgi:hypothetical protein
LNIKGSVDGFEIQVSKGVYGENYCIQILGINEIEGRQRFSLSLKDPILYDQDTHKFADISITSLKKCKRNSYCSIAKTDYYNVHINLPKYEIR